MRDRNSKAGSVATEPLGGHGAPPVYRRGRVCANKGGDARLSIYNGADCCALHDMSAMASRPPRGTARRRRGTGRFKTSAA